jgi:hypothetical protein
MVDSTKRAVDSVSKRKPVSKKHVPAELTESMKKRRAKQTTSDDVPGSGLAKGAARAIEKRKRKLQEY